MKNIILGLILVFSNSIRSQNLTLEQLINLQKKDLVGVEEFLSEKGWSLLKVEKETDTTLGKLMFAYQKSTISDKAESFLNYLYSDSRSRISIQVQNKEKYNLYLNAVKSLAYKLIASKMLDDGIKKVYQNNTKTIIISISTINDYSSTDTNYSYFILSNDDFDNNFKDQY